MAGKKKQNATGDMNEVLAQVQRNRAARDQGYREQALKLFPHICGRCGREFSGKSLRELTVHHKDNDHFNNPPDGSNWELLCIYCHEYEHQATGDRQDYGETRASDRPTLGHRALEGLKDLLQPEADKGEPPPEA